MSAVLQDQLTRESLRQSLRQRFFEPDSDPDTDFPSPPQFQDFSCLSWLKPTTIAPKSIDLVDIGTWHTGFTGGPVEKLPTNGTKWQIEAIRWTRSGGRSFGGSQSVHNRSSWGDIVFTGMTPEKLTAIKRTIIFDAVAKYRASTTLIRSPIGRWNDPELGDPAFYQSEVAPLLARLNAYAAKVNKDMKAVDIETIYSEAVPGWMEIEFHVAELRKQYLENQFFKK